METTTQLPPEIIDAIIAVVSAIVGWFTRWLQTRAGTKKTKEENEKMKTVILEYDQAAKSALRTARRPGP